MTITPLSAEALIDSHPQAELIRRVQSSAYCAYSKRHKLGLDALSWLAGPFAPLGFAAVDDHRNDERLRCSAAVEALLSRLGHSVHDRRVIALLLEDYPGRNGWIAERLRAHLQHSPSSLG